SGNLFSASRAARRRFSRSSGTNNPAPTARASARNSAVREASRLELEKAYELAIITRITVEISAAAAAIAAPRVQVNTRSRFSILRRSPLNRFNGFIPPLYLPINAGSPQLSPPLPAPAPPAAHTTRTNFSFRDPSRPRLPRWPTPDLYFATASVFRRAARPDRIPSGRRSRPPIRAVHWAGEHHRSLPGLGRWSVRAPLRRGKAPACRRDRAPRRCCLEL